MTNSLFIFGYGSLLNLHNCRSTCSPLSYQKAFLVGYKRFWKDRDEMGITFLTIEPDGESLCNGLVLEISHADFDLLKKREKTYDVIDVSVIAECGVIEAKTFVSKNLKQSHSDFPVLQSYVDVELEGVFAQGERFQSDFSIQLLGCVQ